LLPIPQDHHIDDISLAYHLYAYQKKTLLEHSVVISIDFYLIIQYNFVDKSLGKYSKEFERWLLEI